MRSDIDGCTYSRCGHYQVSRAGAFQISCFKINDTDLVLKCQTGSLTHQILIKDLLHMRPHVLGIGKALWDRTRVVVAKFMNSWKSLGEKKSESTSKCTVLMMVHVFEGFNEQNI